VTVIVGDASIERVEEHQLAVPFALLSEDQEFVARRVAPLPPGFLDQDAMTFQFCCQSWLIRVDGLTVLVDPCTGNARKRGVPFFDDLDTPYLQRLADAQAPRQDIDIVFNTHMHYDHCGWNTMDVGGKWTPTFPNATYLFVEAEYRRWDTTAGGPAHPNDFNPSVFDECILPVVEAGQAHIVEAPHTISPSLRIEPAPGHTEGHCLLRLSSAGARAYFVGDVLHHPAQICRPELHMPGCDDLATAIATRTTLFERIHDESALLFPAHFSAPHFGRIGREDGENVFEPGL
jgi:glyoxylase-like metal-dependent hydrolase (beta-lactamase superfamily II)